MLYIFVIMYISPIIYKIKQCHNVAHEETYVTIIKIYSSRIITK